MHHEIELALKNARESKEILEERITLRLLKIVENSKNRFGTTESLIIHEVLFETLKNKDLIKLVHDLHSQSEFIDSYKDIK